MDDLLAATGRVEAEHFWFRGFRAFITPILDTVTTGRPNLRLLDCGCGTGHNLLLLNQYGRAFGFDLTPHGLDLARRSHAPLARASISHIPFRSGSVDVITSFDVLQYVSDDAEAVRECARVLKPDGTAILTAAAMPILRGGHAARWPELRRYTPAALARVVASAGLQVERATYLFGALFPLLLPVRVASRLFAGSGPSGGADAAGRPAAVGGGSEDWEMQVPPAPINEALTWLLRAEAAASQRSAIVPAGSSVLVVARKRVTPDQNRSVPPK